MRWQKKIHPQLKLRVFVDDLTALLRGKNKEVAVMAKKVVKKLIKRGREDRAQVTEDGKDRAI